MLNSIGEGLSNLMSYPVLIGSILGFVILLFFLILKRKSMKKEVKVLLIILAIVTGTTILFLVITAFLFGNSHPIAHPHPQ
jgi:multisubunit Na+/H+ antiporter MnhB subunit